MQCEGNYKQDEKTTLSKGKNNCSETTAAAAAKSLQSCPALCDPIDGSPPGSPVPGILHQEHWSGLTFPSPMQSETTKNRLIIKI